MKGRGPDLSEATGARARRGMGPPARLGTQGLGSQALGSGGEWGGVKVD